MNIDTARTAEEQGRVTGAEMPAMLTAQELGAVLRCSRRTIYRLIQAGHLPPPCRLGAMVRWSSSAVQAWIAAGCPRNVKSLN